MCRNCSKDAFYKADYGFCMDCEQNSFLKNENDSFCTSCKNDSNADFYNTSGGFCYNCSVGLEPNYDYSGDWGCAACSGGLFYNRTIKMCTNECPG